MARTGGLVYGAAAALVLCPMSETPYRVGVIGAGRKGTSHARAYALNPRTRVVAVADPDAQNRELFRRRFGGVPGYADYREMLAREAIDIAAPILPVRPNPDVVVGCAAAGVRAILCEKPLAASLADADRMVAACAEHGVRFGAGDLDRNLPAFRRAQAFAAAELGPARSLTFFGGGGHELSGGGCQIFSLMRLFAGDADAEFAVGWVDGDPASDDDQGGAGYVRFANGVEALVHREPDGRGRGFEVACDGGLVRGDNLEVSVWRAPPGERAGADLIQVQGVVAGGSVYGRRSGGEYGPDGWRWPGDRNVATVQAIVDSLDGGVDPGGSGDNGRKVLELAIALRESHRCGHAPVRLPLADRSLRIVPHPSRMENKKQILGYETYMKQLGSHTNF